MNKAQSSRPSSFLGDRLHFLFRLLLGALFQFTLASAAEPTTPLLAPYNTEPATNGPMPAQEVARRIGLPPGFRCTVFASEPDVQQPISMATDPRGRLWVAENYTYSERRVGYHSQLRDRIVVFEDTDNDGRFDKRTVFWDAAERLTSIEVGLGGVWAICLPNLIFIPDENGDDVPDGPPQVLLDGFEYQNARHTVANGLRWGPDGWLYGRQGILGTSRLGAPGTPESSRTTMNVGIWRYHPTRRTFEVVARGTTNPWGMDWNERGEAFFINTVIGHLWQVIPGAHYRRMFGDDADPHVYELIEQHADHVHWATGEVWTDVRKGVTDATLAAGGGHAHTGLLIYQGGQWPNEWNGRLLTINLHGRRLNVERLDRDGSGVVGRREADAFPIPDAWFRGIDLLAAPDGGVFLSDWSDTGECHDEEGIHRTSGRIYKLGYGPNPAPAVPNLSRLPELELARYQTHSNDWFARQSRRVLADRARRGESLTAARAELLRLRNESASEVHRLRALWALHLTGAENWKELLAALAGSDHERVWAIRLLEDSRHGSPSRTAQFDALATNQLPAMAAAPGSAVVRLALASLLQRLAPAQRPALAKALLSHAEDAADHNLPLLLWYGIEPLATFESGYADLLTGAAIPRVQRLGARRLAEDFDTAPQRLDALLVSLARDRSLATRKAVLDGVADGLAGQRKVPRPASWDAAAPRFAEGADDALRTRLRDLSALFGDGRALEQIREVALNPTADIPRRRAALQSLVEARAPGLRSVCEQLIPIRDLSGTAAQGLALFDDPAIADRLLAEWPKLYGHERGPVLNALTARATWAGRLLDAIASGSFRRGDLGAAQVRQLRALGNAALNQRLEVVWGAFREPDETTRQAALARWKQRLTPEVLQRADMRQGQAAFASLCSACHTLYGAGGKLGPDLTGAGRQNLDYLLDNILFPNAVVPADFRPFTIATKDGRTLTGMVRSRSPRSLVVEMVGETLTLNRGDIESETLSPNSLMPEGLLEGLTEPQSAALFAYLMSTVPPAPTKP